MTDHIADTEVALLRQELEMLMRERDGLLRVAGAAAGFVANLEEAALPRFAYEAADLLGLAINALPEETLQDALASVQAHVTVDLADRRAAARP